MKDHQTVRSTAGILTPDIIKLFFTDHINRLYCSKSYLIEKLAGLIGLVVLPDLKYALTETIEELRIQVARMAEIYELLMITHSSDGLQDIIAFSEKAFSTIPQYDQPEIRDLAILLYLLHAKSMELAPLRTLGLLAGYLQNDRVIQILEETAEEVKTDLALISMIAFQHIKTIRNEYKGEIPE